MLLTVSASSPLTAYEEAVTAFSGARPNRALAASRFLRSKICTLLRLRNRMLVICKCNLLWVDQTLVIEGLNDNCTNYIIAVNTKVSQGSENKKFDHPGGE